MGCRALRGPRKGGDEGLFERLHLAWIAGQRIPSDPVPAQRGVDEPDVTQLDKPQPDHDRFIDIGIMSGVTSGLLPRVTPDDAGVVGTDASKGVRECQPLTGMTPLPPHA